jgi:hypothetical protein
MGWEGGGALVRGCAKIKFVAQIVEAEDLGMRRAVLKGRCRCCYQWSSGTVSHIAKCVLQMPVKVVQIVQKVLEIVPHNVELLVEAVLLEI